MNKQPKVYIVKRELNYAFNNGFLQEGHLVVQESSGSVDGLFEVADHFVQCILKKDLIYIGRL